MTGADIVVLVEGESDRLAVDRAGTRLGVDLAAAGVAIAAMSGVTNVGTYVRRLGPAGRAVELAGLCDVGEAPVVARALVDAGLVGEADQLEDAGFFVCDRDLEDELIRAAGTDRMLEFIDGQGELAAFETMQKQPAHRNGDLHGQLHRFFGTRGGRKIRYAPALVDFLPPADLPSPLVALIDHVR